MYQAVIELMRGGYVVKTSAGPIQLGVPPETIKDTMATDVGVPQTYILPQQLFSVERAISLADLEFPIYYNFFIKQQRIVVICEEDQKERMRNVLKQTLFSPITREKVIDEFALRENDPSIPDFGKELSFFMWSAHLGRHYKWEDLVQFRIIRANRPLRVGEVTITLHKKLKHFVVTDKGNEVATLPWALPVTVPKIEKADNDKLFIPPLFGVSVLGRSHGFDPTAPTSGFIFWIDGRGVMVDPPVDSNLKLRSRNVSPKLVNDVILTHVHSDHDAGLLQKIFEEGKVNLYTTQNIFESFLCKAQHLTNYSKDDLKNLITFRPIRIGIPVNILGANFTFAYGLHSVPTIQMAIYFQGKSIFYTADHVYDTDVWEKLRKDGILTPGRYEALKRASWDHTMILHEAGFPPTHTPIKNLLALDKEIKDRLYLVHVGDSNLPPSCDIRLAPSSIENFLSISVETHEYHLSSKILRILSNLDFMSDFPIAKLVNIMPHVATRYYKANSIIMRQGEIGDEFHIVIHGNIGIRRDGSELMVYGPNDYYGEMAVISGKPRSADVIAKTDVEIIVIKAKDFLAFGEGTSVIPYLDQLEKTRRYDSCPLLEGSPVFSFLTPTQITQMQAIMRHATFPKDHVLIKEGQGFTNGFIISEGSILIFRENNLLCRLGRGSFIGELSLLLQNKKQHQCKAVAETDVHLYKIERQPLKRFIMNHPGVQVRLLHYSKYTAQSFHFQLENKKLLQA